MKALVEFWINKTPSSQIRLPEDEKFLNGQNVYWAGWGGHAILGFDDILSGGIDYIRKKLSLYNERVGGYSEYFNRLSQAHKDDIISRTEHIF
ncbi:MAG: hypothetical protein ACUVWN_14855 [bacterium]